MIQDLGDTEMAEHFRNERNTKYRNSNKENHLQFYHEVKDALDEFVAMIGSEEKTVDSEF